MSDKFIQSRIWNVKEEDGKFNKSTLLDVQIGDADIEKLQGTMFALIASRGASGNKNWKKYMLECIINSLQEMAQAASPNVKPPYTDNRLSEHDIDIEMLNQLRTVANALQHMVNSTSWTQGKYHSFDAYEICKRLETASKIR